MRDKLRVGLSAPWYRSRVNASRRLALPDAEIVAIATSPQTAALGAEMAGVGVAHVYDDYEKMLGPRTRRGRCAPQLRHAADRGTRGRCHVFVEKPVAIRLMRSAG